MKKVCVFCGNPPVEKNKEHIIPKWLMKITNMENKSVSVGTDWRTGKELIFNFSSFTFPACTECNTSFSKTESLVKPIVEKILIDGYIETEELILLLDWFDKVRISLWLGIQYLSNGVFNLEPKFYINNRVGLKDRFLSITNTNDHSKTLKWTGANTMCFIYSPTCFTLKINHIIFVNCSSDFLVSEQLGFPYALFVRPNPSSDLIDFNIIDGKENLENQIFKTVLYAPNTSISQVVYSVAKEGNSRYYETDYVKNNSYNYDRGQGKLFVSHDGLCYPMELGEEISFKNEENRPKIYRFNKPTLELQIELLKKPRYNLEFLNDTQKRQHFEAIKLITEYTLLQIKNYNY